MTAYCNLSSYFRKNQKFLDWGFHDPLCLEDGRIRRNPSMIIMTEIKVKKTSSNERSQPTSSSVPCSLTHLDALMLALFRKLRVLDWVWLCPFCGFAFVLSKPLCCCIFGGLWRVVATDAEVRLSASSFCPPFSSLGWQTLSLEEKWTEREKQM